MKITPAFIIALLVMFVIAPVVAAVFAAIFWIAIAAAAAIHEQED